MSDLRMELIQGQLRDIEENVRSIKATWGNTIMTLDNIKSGLKADRQRAIDEAYQKGYDAAWVNVGECEDRVAKQAYQKGFEAGQHEATTIEYQQGLEEGKKQAKAQAHLDVCHDIERVAHGNYQQGLDDAWGTIIKIALIPYAERSEIFDGRQDILSIVQKFSPSEVTAKLREYEQQKADEIKVGDEVRNTLGLMDNAVGFVIGITIEGDYNVSRYIDGKIKTGTWRRENCVKTGKHSDTVVQLLAEMEGGAE